MAMQDKAMLMHKVEGTLKPRMFANLLEEAVEEIQEHLDEFDVTHIPDEQEGEYTDAMLDAYIAAKESENRSEKTLVRYRYIIERFMKHVGVKTRDVNTYHVRDYITREQERGVADSTLEGTRQTLNAYFGWLEHNKIICSNPVSNVAPIKCQEKVKGVFSQFEIEKMRRSCNTLRDAAIINFLLATGCRISEATNLNRSDIDFDNSECVVDGKGAKERTVYLNEIALMTLKEYLASRDDDSDALFIGSRKERLQPNGVRVMLKVLSKRSGVENIYPHKFRRTLITQLLVNGMKIQDVAIVAGHDRLDTTMSYYKSNKERIKDSYRRYAA